MCIRDRNSTDLTYWYKGNIGGLEVLHLFSDKIRLSVRILTGLVNKSIAVTCHDFIHLNQFLENGCQAVFIFILCIGNNRTIIRHSRIEGMADTFKNRGMSH